MANLTPRKLDFQETWRSIKDVIESILETKPISRTDWFESFRKVYFLSIDTHYSKEIPEALFDLFENHVNEIHNDLCGNLSSDSNNAHLFLEAYAKTWKNFNQGLEKINKLFHYWNQENARQQPLSNPSSVRSGLGFDNTQKYPPVSEKQILAIGYMIWRTKFLLPSTTSEESLVYPFVAAYLEKDRRCCGGIDMSCLNDVVNSFLVAGNQPKSKLILAVSENDETETPFKMHLVNPLLRDTSNFYHTEAASLWKSSSTTLEYVTKVHSLIEAENARCASFLPEDSQMLVSAEIHRCLVTEYCDKLLSELFNYLRTEQNNEIRLFFSILRNIKSILDQIKDEFVNHVTSRGIEALTAVRITDNKSESAAKVISVLVEVNKKYSEMQMNGFLGDNVIGVAFARALKAVVNASGLVCHQTGVVRTPDRIAFELAFYLSSLLSNKSSSSLGTQKEENYEEILESKIDSCMTILDIIDNRDLFRNIYVKNLAKRLLYGESCSFDMEELVFMKISNIAGSEFISGMNRMCQDIQSCSTLRSKFLEWLEDPNSKSNVSIDRVEVSTSKANEKIDEIVHAPTEASVKSILEDVANFSPYPSLKFNVSVLSTNVWPYSAKKAKDIKLPIDFDLCVKYFEAFYAISYPARKLKWMHHLTNGDLTLDLKSGHYMLTLTIFQMFVLLYLLRYSQEHQLVFVAFNDILAEYNLFDYTDELSVQVVPLITLGLVIIDTDDTDTSSGNFTTEENIDSNFLTMTKGKGFSTRVALNIAFENKKRRIKVSSGPKVAKQLQKQKDEEREKIAITKDRLFCLEALVVRIMKARKTCDHNELIVEVTKQAARMFSPPVSMIKSTIERLLERGYLKRNEISGDVKTSYTYIN